MSTHPITIPPFRRYRRKELGELRPWMEGEVLGDCASISQADRDAGSPKAGDMIARNPRNYDDQWLVSEVYFKANFDQEPLG